MLREIALRKDYLSDQTIGTIYFGGGTPSLLSGDEIKRLLDKVYEQFDVLPDAEITLEANPDDLTREKIRELKSSPVNRLSIGIQSFRDDDLKWMNRAHTSTEADYAVKCAQDHGFENITIDLIYSIPGMTDAAWKQNLLMAFDLQVQHISAYGLTIEPRTFFGHQQKKGQLTEMEQERSGGQFLLMLDEMDAHGFEQYEVSNFCKSGFESKHNSSYWKGNHYIGYGPSAHSFDGNSRQWNVSNNSIYIKELAAGKLPYEKEELSQTMRLNEYIMTGLRTKWGIDLRRITTEYSFDFQKEYADMIADLSHDGRLILENDLIILTRKGLLTADRIASDFFVTD